MQRHPSASTSDPVRPEIDRVVHEVYDSALDPSAWDRIGHQLCSVFDATSFLLVAQSRRERRVEMLETNWSPAQLDNYIAHFYDIDCWMEQGLRQPPMTPMIGEQCVPDHEFVNTELYYDFAKPNDIRHLMGIWGTLDSGAQCSLALHRSAYPGSFDTAETRELGRLFQHILRSVRLREALAAARRSEGICQAALNELSAGVVVVDGLGVVVLANRAAEALAAARDGFTLSAGNGDRAIAASMAKDTQHLRRMIARAAPRDGAAPAGGSMRLRAPAGAGDYAVTVTPLPRMARGLRRGDYPLALLLVTKLSAPAQVPEQLLRELFGLTNAEARLVAYLAQGRTRAEYAEQAGIAAFTVKTHLSNAFTKLGVSRESELVRLALAVKRP